MPNYVHMYAFQVSSALPLSQRPFQVPLLYAIDDTMQTQYRTYAQQVPQRSPHGAGLRRGGIGTSSYGDSSC